MRRILTTLAVWLALAAPAWAACAGSSPTWTAASAARADVADCVTAAAAGDTINVPAGSATWASAITVSKALSIIGAGSDTGGTVLTSTLYEAGVSGFFYVTNVTSTALLRISGFRFLGSSTTPYFGINVENSVSLSALRIDHNYFDEGKVPVQVTGATGVVDHNDFYNCESALSFSAGSVEQANASWVSMAAGTASALFFEDNTIVDNADYPLAYTQEKIGTNNGGKLVVRYNVFDFRNFTLDAIVTPFMAHGSASGYWQRELGGRRGQSVIEFYENTIYGAGKYIDFLYQTRGSANLVYNNDLIGTLARNPRIYFREEEKEAYGSAQSNWSVEREAWPAEDQVHNTFVWGNTYPNTSTPYFNSIDHVALPYQNADCTANDTPMKCCTGSGTGTCDFIVLDREFFLHAPAATGGKASFAGLNGGSNTYPTDGNTYPTLGTMTFSASGANEYYGYVAYTYPHPLTAAPAAPTNVRIR
jgi:hypothetical protein